MRLLSRLQIATVSEANSRDYWRVKAARAKKQREAVKGHFAYDHHAKLMLAEFRSRGMPSSIHLTRVSPRALDSDNLASSCKAIRDGIQDVLGINDRHLNFCYYQRREGSQKFVEIGFEWVELLERMVTVPASRLEQLEEIERKYNDAWVKLFDISKRYEELMAIVKAHKECIK